MLGTPLVAVGAIVWYAVLFVGLGLVLFMAIKGNWFARINAFFADVRAELKKVSWPSWPELRSATWVVIVSTVLVTVFIVIVDFVLDKVLRPLITR
jgi:preprotein translocase subunit SecE